MPEYLHPGVYIEELPAPQTIEGVSTSNAGFVGATQRGPTSGLPRLVTSFADFRRLYGSFLPADPWGDTRFLAHAVDAFFNNGGKRLYVTRVVGEGAAESALTLRDGFVTRLLEDTSAALAGRNRVRLASLRGISVGSTLAFNQVLAGAEVDRTRTVTSYNHSINEVVLDAPLDLRFTASGCRVSLQGVADAPLPALGDPVIQIEASSEGIWGRDIQVSVADGGGATGSAQAAAVQTALTATSLAFDAAGPAGGTTEIALADVGPVAVDDIVRFDDGGDPNQTEQRAISEIAGNVIRWADGLDNDYSGGGSSVERLTALRAGAANPVVSVADTTGFAPGDLVRVRQGTSTQTLQIAAAPGSVNSGDSEITLDTSTLTVAQSYLAGASFALATAGRSGSNRLDLTSARSFYDRAVIEIDDGATKSYHTVNSIDGRSLVLTANLGRDVAEGTAVRILEFSINLELSDGTVESFRNLTLDEATSGFAEGVVNESSRLVRITVTPTGRTAPFHLPSTDTGTPANLTGGADGDPPSADHYVGVDNGPGDRSGLKALEDIDGVQILAVPGISEQSVHNELISQCERLKDRFAVLDPERGSDIASVIQQRSNYDSLYAALYYPWLDANGTLLPPSGHVVGIYARVDNNRGVHKAPANEVIRGITGLEFKLNDREQDVLNPAPTNINVIRDFRDSGRGIRVWGSRCITSDSAFKYVPVRRLFIFVEESLDEGLQWVVFEPNAEPLWARVNQTISGFLRRIWRDGALEGVTEEQAFFVRVDRTTMTQDDIDNGRLIALVGIAPVKPAEFVIIRISQKTLEATS